MNKEKFQILHVSTAHKRFDTRIFAKECFYLKNKYGYNISLMIADGKGNEVIKGVPIFDIGSSSSITKRYISNQIRAFKFISSFNAEIIHIHDPELIIIAFLLKILKKIKVIYDVHEDFYIAILDRPYLNKYLRKLISVLYEFLERITSKHFDFIITATSHINDRFKHINKSAIINNYPIIGELSTEIKKIKKRQICFLGAIDLNRGIGEVVDSLEMIDGRLKLAGFFDPSSVRNILVQKKGWSKVDELGIIDRKSASDLFSESVAGICTYYPLGNHLYAQPNKIFEYMSAGLPIIISNFPVWVEILKKYNCGVAVDPLNPKSIADGINYLLNNPEKAKSFGENGLRAIIEELNWDQEVEKLDMIYRNLI